MNNILKEIKKLEEYNIKVINMLALITDTSSEVIFYCQYNNCLVQSNNLVEEYGISSVVIEKFYDIVAESVRKSKEYKSNLMNIIKVKDNKIDFSYDDKGCRSYKIIKQWKLENK